jgi:membrane-bound ClpP family serine protease
MGAIALVFAEFKWLSKSPLGKNLFLSKTVSGSSNVDEKEPDIVGKTGESITELHPEGLVRIGDKEYDAFCEEGLLPKGSKVLVTGMDDFRIRIRPE